MKLKKSIFSSVIATAMIHRISSEQSKLRKIKILFIYDEMRSFTQKDLEILQKHFIVKPLKYTGKKDIIKILYGVLTTDVNFSWFALGYATMAVFFSKIFRKKSIVVAGGWDVVDMPEIDYGAMRNPKRVRKTKFTLKHADKVLAVSESTRKDVSKFEKNANVETLYHGFDSSKSKTRNKENVAISIGTSTWNTLKVKGIETFVKSAKFLPNIQFIVIGPQKDDSINYLKTIASSNVDFIDFLPTKKLLIYLKKAKVYVQVSAQESFGSALAEAMLCECVPVVTNRGAIPEVVGDTGFYVLYGDPEQTAQKIKEALESDKGKAARERIKILFPFEKRELRLVQIINNLLIN